MNRWKWPLRWFLPLALLFVLLTSSQAAPALMTHTTAADFSRGDGDNGFIITQHQDGELTLIPHAMGITPWTELTSTALPQILYEHTAVAANGHLFVIGGRNNSGLKQTVYRAAILSNGILGSWQAMPALPQPLHHHATVKASGGLLVIGGQRSLNPDEPVATVYRAAVADNGNMSNWVELTETPLPQALKNLGAAAVNGYLFVIGGRDSNNQRQPAVYRAPLNADGTLGAWTTTISLPVSLASHAVATTGNCIFITGGRSDLGEQSQVYSAAVGANGEITAWQELTDARLPQPLADHTAAVVGGQLFIVGGNSGVPVQDHDQVYRATINADCTLEPWEELTGSALLRRMQDHAMATADGYLFVTGGHRFGNSEQYDTVYQAVAIPNPNLGGWRELGQTPLPQPLSAHAATLSGDYLFVTGGLGVNDVQSTVYRGNAPTYGQTDQWAQVTSLPQPLQEHATIAVDDRLLTIGGHNGNADQDTVYETVVNADGSLSAWQSHPCTLPVALRSHAAVLTNGYIYLSGGLQVLNEQDQVYRLKGDDDGTQGCWQAVTALPESLAEHAMAATENYLFVSGGVTSRGGEGRDTVYSATIELDGSLGDWIELSNTPLPTPLRSHIMVTANGYLYVAGGFDPFLLSVQHQVYRAKIKADGGLEAWEELTVTPLPQAVENHAAVVTDLYLLVIGGYRSNQPQNTVYVTSLYQGAHQAVFTHQFDLGSVQDIGLLNWWAWGDPDAVLNARFRFAVADAEYGPWSEAAASPPIPVYEQGRYLQYQLLVKNPNGGVKMIDKVSLTYGDVGDYVKAVDDYDAAVPSARVYLNGQFAGETNSRGVLPPEYLPGGLRPDDDRLAVLSLVTQTTTIRDAHATPDSGGVNWAYRTYVTSIEVADDGSTHTYVVTQTGRQLLTVKKSNPLVLFNVVASIEWDATITYTQQVSHALRSASDYLYDVSDGQFAFGHVTIYDNDHYWPDADIQLSVRNNVRPYAFVGGITAGDKAWTIRVGRGWDRWANSRKPWNAPDGFRTLIHEFGHYGLHLYDEYFEYLYDNQGNLTGVQRSYCTGPENRDEETDATNASIMDWQYTTSELAMRDVPGLWANDYCTHTAQWQLNNEESDWETVTRSYTDTTGLARWAFVTPADRCAVVPGPGTFPSQTLPFPTVVISNTGTDPPSRTVKVLGPDCLGYPGALVALDPAGSSTIDQGFTDEAGEIIILGAAEGDKVRAMSLDGALSASISVTESTAYSLSMGCAGGVRIAAQSVNPYVSLVPSSDGRTLYPSVQGVEPGGAFSALVIQPGSTVPQMTQLVYSTATHAYTGTVSFSYVDLGTGGLYVRGLGPQGQQVAVDSDFSLLEVDVDQVSDLYSADGNLQLHLDEGSFSEGEVYAVLMSSGAVPQPLPSGRRAVGNAYAIRFSGVLPQTAKPGVLKLFYHPDLLAGGIDPHIMSIYRWDAGTLAWEPLGGELDEGQRSVAAAFNRVGIYALLAAEGPVQWVYLPLVMR